MSDSNVDVRVYPIDEPKGNTLAFANVRIDGMVAINGIRAVNSDKGVFVAMPQSQDNTGLYHDTAFPLNKELRKTIADAVIAEFATQANLYPEQRGYVKSEQDTSVIKNVEDIKLDVKVFPFDDPKGDTLAFASIGLDDAVAIRGIRVVNSDKGPFVSMPQSQDRDGKFHDVAFPLSGDLRKAVSNAVLADFRQQSAERKQSIGKQLAAGAEKSAQYKNTRAVQPQAAYAKRSAGNAGLE